MFKDERYKRLTQNLGISGNDTVHEVGFGLGHFFDYLNSSYGTRKGQYSGSEVTQEYLDAMERTGLFARLFLHDITAEPLQTPADWVIFPGTFYHLASTNTFQMARAIEAGLTNGFASCRKGIAVNFVTTEVEYRKKGLMYLSPAKTLSFALLHLSRFASVDHSSPLFEFSLTVLREDWVAAQYSQKEFRKYF